MKISNIISTSTKNTRFHKITEVLLKNELVTLILRFQSTKLKRAWQAQFLIQTLVTLGNDVFLLDV